MATEEEQRLRHAKRLREALQDLSRQAQQTAKDLQSALTIPEDALTPERVELVTVAIQKQSAAYRTGAETLKKLERLETEAAATAATRLIEGQKAMRDLAARRITVDEYKLAVARLTAAERTATEVASQHREATVAGAETQTQLKEIIDQSTEAKEIYADILNDIAIGTDVTAEKWAMAGAKLNKFNKDVKVGDLAFQSLADSMLGGLGGLGKFQGLLAAGAGGRKGFISNLTNMKSVMGLATGAMLKLVKVSFDFAMETDKIYSEFRKTTGAGTEFNQVIKDVEGSGRIAGVTLKETAQAVGALKNTFTDFTYYSVEVQKEIASTTTILAEIGFSAQNQAEIWQTATQAMGMSIRGAQSLMLDITSTARSLGIDVDKLGASFIKNQEILVRYGSRAGIVFQEMAVQAKALGVDTDTLLGLMDRFKQFDTAGEAVGRLNAILGGPYLNSIDMLNASLEDPIEGIKMLKGAFDEAGISADALSGAELLAFSSALGVSAKDTATILGQTNEELEVNRMTMEEANEAARKAQDIMSQLQNSFRQLIVDAEPFVTNVLRPMIENFGDLMGQLGTANRAMGAFAATTLIAGLAFAGLMMATGIGSPIAIAALSVLGAAGALGVGALATRGGEEAGAAAAPTQVAGFSSGGRVLNYRPRKRQSLSPGGRVGVLDQVWEWIAGDDTEGMAETGPPNVPIRMNEGGAMESAFLPSGTYVQDASDTTKMIQGDKDTVAELKGLRKDIQAMARNTNKKVKLVLDNGREFSTTVVREGLANSDVVTPFGNA